MWIYFNCSIKEKYVFYIKFKTDAHPPSGLGVLQEAAETFETRE